MSLILADRMSRMPPSAVREILKVAERPDILSFAGGLPAPELFPSEAIAQAVSDVCRQNAAAALQYSTTEGYTPLREWIVARLRRQGIDASLDNTLITSGSQQGIDLAGRVLLNAGDRIAVEDPSYLAALQAFGAYEAQFVCIPSDDDGMQVDVLEREAARGLTAIYIVPNFQNPKGTTLSLERRHKLIAIATKHNIAIIEDDPYGELRFRGEALPSLASLDDQGVVIRLGSFSKTLAPGLRIGFATGPRDAIRAMTIAKQAADLHTGSLVQRAAARLLETFDFEGHLAILRTAYGARARRDAPGTRQGDARRGVLDQARGRHVHLARAPQGPRRARSVPGGDRGEGRVRPRQRLLRRRQAAPVHAAELLELQRSQHRYRHGAPRPRRRPSDRRRLGCWLPSGPRRSPAVDVVRRSPRSGAPGGPVIVARGGARPARRRSVAWPPERPRLPG